MKYHLVIARSRKFEISLRGNYDFQHEDCSLIQCLILVKKFQDKQLFAFSVQKQLSTEEF